MREPTVITFILDGESFALEGELAADGAHRRAHPGGQYLQTAYAVVVTAWLYGPEKLVDAVIGRRGMSFEGVVSFDFPEGGDWLGPVVETSYFEEELVVEEAVFGRLVHAFGCAYMKLDRRLGVATPDAFSQALDTLAAHITRLGWPCHAHPAP